MPRLELAWDELHPQARQEAAAGLLRADIAATIKWADIEPWQRADICRNTLSRSYGRVRMGGAPCAFCITRYLCDIEEG